MLYFKAKEFIENFKLPLDYEDLSKQLTEISLLNYKLHNCDKDIKITFDESILFGKSASVSGTSISFNKTRLETLLALKIDDSNPNHISKVYSFYNTYKTEENHSKYEICLYEFMKKYIEGGYERYFSQMGNYKTIKYELLDAVFHENEHIFQKDYEKYLNSADKCPTDNKSLALFFTVLFNEIYGGLKKNKIEFIYDRENYIFPIEFDARYEAMVNINKVKQYFPDDKLFAEHIINSNLIPENFDISLTVIQMFEDYERLYRLYNDKISNNYASANAFINKHKQAISDEFKRRYVEMNNIENANKPNIEEKCKL